MQLKIKLLGQPSIAIGEDEVDLPGYRPLALLAYLILTRKPHHREHLIDLLFDSPDDPRAALRWTLSKLRKTLGSQYILADRQTLAFNFESDYWLDVFAFEGGESDHYQGDLLEGVYLREAARFEEWLHFERQRLRDKYQSDLEKQLKDYQAQDDPAAVVLTAQYLLKLDYLREDWQYSLIEAYACLGKRTIALDQFEKYQQALRKIWNVEPGVEILTLVEAIQCGTYRASPLPPAVQATPHPEQNLPGAEVKGPSVQPYPREGRQRGRSWLAMAGLLGLLGALFLLWRIAFNSSPPVNIGQAQAPPLAGIEGTSTPGQSALAGKTVYILGPFFDEQARLFEQGMLPFEKRTGIQVEFLTGGTPYESFLENRLQMQDLPDIVVFPQPGWLGKLSVQRKVIDLRTFLDEDYLVEQFPETFLSLASVEEKLLGIWYVVGLKSLVWYPKQAFEEKGYQVPATWDELIALSDQIVADGGTPWCIGIDDLEATGWVGTDWVEDILLRTAPPETYDAWVRHELPFDSPQIQRVFEIMGQIWLNDSYVYGGHTQISEQSIFESPAHMFDDPPGCYLHKQASFAPFFFPPEARFGEDYDFFYLPPIDPQYGHPALGSGEFFAMFNDRPEVREVMSYLTTVESRKPMIQVGNFLSPHRATPLEWYPSPAELRFAEIVLSADTYRFDGSDLMPGEVGLGSFFHGITAWVEGADLQTVLQEIDQSWPSP